MAFDPDVFLATSSKPASQGFDPEAFLAVSKKEKFKLPFGEIAPSEQYQSRADAIALENQRQVQEPSSTDIAIDKIASLIAPPQSAQEEMIKRAVQALPNPIEAAKQGAIAGEEAATDLGASDNSVIGQALKAASAGVAGTGSVIGDLFRPAMTAARYPFVATSAAAQALGGDTQGAISKLATPEAPVVETQPTNVNLGNVNLSAIANVVGDTFKSVFLENPELAALALHGKAFEAKEAKAKLYDLAESKTKEALSKPQEPATAQTIEAGKPIEILNTPEVTEPVPVTSVFNPDEFLKQEPTLAEKPIAEVQRQTMESLRKLMAQRQDELNTGKPIGDTGTISLFQEPGQQELRLKSGLTSSEEASLKRAAEEDQYKILQEQLGQHEELLDAVMKEGGIPTPSNEGKMSGLSGEIQNIREAAKKSPRYFRKSAKSLDQLAEALRGRGFDFQTPTDLVEALYNRINQGIKQYSGSVIEDFSMGPGAASAAEVLSKGTEISQLSDVIKHIGEQTPSLGERMKLSEEAAHAITSAKDTVNQGFSKIRAIGTAFYDALTKPPEYTFFKKNLNEWLGQLQKSDLDLQRFTESIKENIPSSLRRTAITNYIQAGGDTALLLDRASKSKGLIKSGYEMAANLSENEKLLAGNIGQYFDAKLQEGIDAGLLEHGVKNYVSQLWAKDNVATQKLLSDIEMGRLNKDFKFAKERIFSSFFEGEQAGFKPKTKDIGAIITAYDQSFNQSVASRAFIKQLTEKGKSKDGRPLVVLSGAATTAEEGSAALFVQPQAKPKAYGDYIPLDHPALRGWKWVETDQATGKNVFLRGNALIHPEIYDHMKAVFTKSALREGTLGKILSPLFKAQAFVKQNMLSLGMFHLVQEGQHAIGYRVNPFVVSEIDLNNPLQMEGVNHGLQIATFHGAQEFSEGLAGGTKSIVQKLPILGPQMEIFQHWLFQKYIPNLKMKTYLTLFDRNLKRYGKTLSRDRVSKLSADQANAAYGELNYKSMGRNATTQDFFKLFALAPDFLEARIRNVAQAVTRYGAEQRHNLLLLGMGTYITARILNKLSDDDYHWEEPFRIFYNGKRYGFRIIPEDVHNLFTNTRVFISGRLSPFASHAVEALTGIDYRGVPISRMQVLENLILSPIPIGLRRFPDKSIEDTILINMGIQVGSASNVQQMYQKARDFNKETNFRQDQADHFYESKYKNLKTQLELGDMKAAKKEYDRLSGQTNPKSFHTSIMASFAPRRLFTGKKSQEAAFLQTLDERSKQRYEDAVKERIDLLKKLKEVEAMP